MVETQLFNPPRPAKKMEAVMLRETQKEGGGGRFCITAHMWFPEEPKLLTQQPDQNVSSSHIQVM